MIVADTRPGLEQQPSSATPVAVGSDDNELRTYDPPWMDPDYKERVDPYDQQCRRCGSQLPEPDLVLGAHVNVPAFLGWFYGYAACCVENFIRDDAVLGLETHPVSRHRLCPGCVVDPKPLRDRAADRWVVAHPHNGGWVLNGRGIQVNRCDECE